VAAALTVSGALGAKDLGVARRQMLHEDAVVHGR
jgi:hypothetical protein